MLITEKVPKPLEPVMTPDSFQASEMISDEEDELPIEIVTEKAEIEEKESLNMGNQSESFDEQEEDPMFKTFFKNRSTLKVSKVIEEKTLVTKKTTLIVNGKKDVLKPEEPPKKRDL